MWSLLVWFWIALAVAFAARTAVLWYARRCSMREQILNLFAAAGVAVDAIGIDMDWVALQLCGYPAHGTRIVKLPEEAQARVIELREEAIEAARRLVKEGLLAPFDVTFDNRGKYQEIKPPRSLFKLAPLGKSEVLRRRAKLLTQGG